MSNSNLVLLPTEEAVHKALTLWHQSDAHDTPFGDLLLWQQLAHTYQGARRRTTNELLVQAFHVLAREDPDLHKILELRFIQEESGQRIANQMHMAEGTVWRKQREAIIRLSTILQEQESNVRAARRSRFAARLETPTYTHLIGSERHLATLAAQINQPGAPT